MTTLRETFEEHVYDGGWRCECDWTGSFDEWAAHLEAVVLAWVGARLAGADVLEDVCEAIADVSGCPDRGEAEAAIRAIGEALGTHGHADEGVRPADRLPGGSTGVVCEACPFLGCDGCEAEAARRANGEAK